MQKQFEDVLIDVLNLKKYFPIEKGLFKKIAGFTKAVNDVSFNIRKKEILGLVGESGSGKTTIGKLLVKILKPDSGTILYKGKDFSQVTRKEIATHIQMIFQNPYSSLNPKLCVGTILGEAVGLINREENNGYSKQKIREKVVELLETVGLNGNMYNDYPHQLSGGQRQRVCIARALAVKPELIIADEPVSSLDISIQAQIINLLADLKDGCGLSYLLVTHDLNVVRYICDRVIVIHNGIIIEEGVTKTIFSNPSHEYTVKLLSAIPEIPA